MEKQPQENMSTNIEVVGYIHSYLKDNKLKTKFIPSNLKESFLERFGNDLLNTDEDEINWFLKNSK